MTVAELINQLAAYDPSRVVCIDTLGFHRGVFPMADEIGTYDDVTLAATRGEGYSIVVLMPSEWP
jgi:hypothetical protein